MASDLDFLCKFKIGDNLALKAQVAFCTDASGLQPQMLTVLARHVDECYGGIQVFYECRITAIERFRAVGFVKDAWRVSEPEVQPYPVEILTRP